MDANNQSMMVEDVNPDMLWIQYIDYLATQSKIMKKEYIRRKRANKPFTWNDLDVMNKKIHHDLDVIMSGVENVQENKQNTNMNKKLIRLTESELKNIVETSVRRAIQEGAVDEGWGKDMLKTAAIGGGLGLGMAGAAGAGVYDDQMDAIENNSRAFPEDRAEYGDRLNPQGELPADTISWEKANQLEGKISKAIAESISNLMNEVAWTDSQGVQHSGQHGNDRAAWEKLRKERWNRYATKTVDGMTNKEKNAHLKNAEASCRNGSFEEALPDKRGDRRPGMAKARMESSKDIQAHRKKWYN